MTIPNNYTVRQIMSFECKEWFLKKHYAKRLPTISYAFGLYKNKNNLLIGVCSYGKPMSSTLVSGSFNGLYQNNFLELNRLVIQDNTKKNVLSYFVSQTLKNLQTPSVVVSYADTSQHHHGYIYQATNWIYTGLSAKRPDYKIKGLEHLHSASITDSLGRTDKKNIKQVQLLRNKYGKNFYMVDRPRKHRYFYFIGNKKQRKEMIKNLVYKVEPYPKGNNKKYDSSYEPTTQGILF
mgnify:CR=1 FL=1|tara:strand:- start:257 stop:964 length:708 start_codon:yes stop_codon:yes gene_type:complete